MTGMGNMIMPLTNIMEVTNFTAIPLFYYHGGMIQECHEFYSGESGDHQYH
jgi:hypothetical protein